MNTRQAFYDEILELERLRDAIVAEQHAKGKAKFEVLDESEYQRQLAQLRERLDALYNIMDWD